VKPSTTKMSSKGQVVIPEEIREQLGLTAGTQFVVVGDRDVVILKTLSTPSMSEFDTLIGEARRQAKTAKMSRTDLQNAVKAEKVKK
jgi:AbrB family looped-hinge helix DNA binding protein